ncbi:cilia- and flagella-associated protein 61 isoform X2 [Ictalurus punctatus]|uniref:Cilia- and flagella-associated protein 61 isoform X1 n=1 Tax=Ictalurus punctatus TaxID=7998 RepID=A0A2D0Q3J7_ICTPU|nr:cilia- and flagella-associated protein 61 isoform X1 [Ictalurus punctatus]XP_017312262.1 cilia- and flagella-associated protein 61 isoform X2 [Ictalurus punctatus]
MENMTTITSSTGEKKSVIVRRTESCDAHKITELISPATAAVFGRVNVIYLLEKANLAVTISTAKNEVLAHAAFVDHPIGDLVDQASWEQLLQTHFNTTKFTPLNTIFLHLFVAQPSFSISIAKEIIRTVFNAITELEYICLVTPYSSSLEPALMDIFEPMPCVTEEVQGGAFVCHRHNFCPRLHVRRARVEDLIDLTSLEQMKTVSDCWPVLDTLAEKIEAEDEMNHVAVFENDGLAVGFIIVSGKLNLLLLNKEYELGPFDGLRKKKAEKQSEDLDPESQPEESTVDIADPHPQSEVNETEPVTTHRTESRGNGAASEAEDNAFLIQIQIDKRFETRAADCLPYVFQLFPEQDFCIILVHTLDSDSPLLQTFIRAMPRDCRHRDLYIFHRSGLLKTIEVRAVVSEDKSAIQELVPQHEDLMEDLDLFLHQDPDVQAFVAQVEDQIIGVLVIKNEQDIEYIRANYDIENFVYFSHHQREEHGRLCQFALNPIFQHYAKHFLKEALRLAHKSCLYYRVYPSYHSDKRVTAHSLTAVLSCMVPVRPRHQIIYPLEDLGINAPSTFITTEQVPYALNHINRKLTMEPKVNINAKIVVVGASDTGLAFLEALAFCPHLQFNNLTLISPHGLPEHLSTDNMSFLVASHCYNQRDHAQLSLCSWVNVLKGKMTAIDRKMTRVQVNGDHYIPYDQLILCTGQQYQMLCPTGIDISTWSLTSSVPEQRIRRYTGHIPSNLFTLNDQQDCTQAYHWLMENFVLQEGNAVVYGDTIDVYTCVETLLQMGVTGFRIHVVHQTAAGSLSCFQSLTVDQAVRTALEKQDVHVHHNCLLAQMNDGQHPEPLTSVSFTTDGLPFRLECAVFFNFFHKGVDYDSFKAVNSTYLLFDGRLVIDSTFQTNDCKIHAAGPLTKLSRSCYADQWSHSYFNSKEVGQELATMLLHLFDPTLEPPAKPAPDADRLIPIYKQSKITGGKLPGGYHYLHVTKPSGYTDVSPSVSSTQGRSIATGSVETGNYFQLQFSRYNMVENITCLSFNPLPVSNYLCLYGKHQLLLNRLYARFDEELIQDLYSYFRESWCMAIFHDRFADFQQEVHQIMTDELHSDSTSLTKLLETVTDGTLELSEHQSGQREALTKVKESVLEYLQFNQYHLPMYTQPALL